MRRSTLHPLRRLVATLALPALSASGCVDPSVAPEPGQRESAITQVSHTPVERQSIGNCWLYAAASWVESMNLAYLEAQSPGAEVEPLDVSQSYWTYWHWFDQVTGYMWKSEISTGGGTWQSNAIMRDRGLMKERDFVEDDSLAEMSQRQSSALATINSALKSGELSTEAARRDRELVRRVFDDAWGLNANVRAQLDQVFGKDGAMKLRSGAKLTGTQILNPSSVKVRYAKWSSNKVTYKNATLVDAIREWRTVSYPTSDASRRQTLIRVQRALHARQPVGVTWNVDFNALENYNEERRGSFNLKTLEESGRPGRQGGHMTVLHDYEAETKDHGVLEAGVTLDPNVAEDALKLEAALAPETTITLLRTKNSWGASRADRSFAPGFPGYHDLWMDYLNGPFKWCPDSKNPSEDCNSETQGLRELLMPPGF
jgi:hypothetical protein